MKYAVGMGSSAVIYVPSSITIGSDVQKLVGVGMISQIHRQHGDCISLFLFFSK
jgi:hypothetical protein